MRSLALAATLLFALAGCSSDDPTTSTTEGEPFTCADGTVVDLATAPNHHDADFDPQRDLCPNPPSIVLGAFTQEIIAYHTGTVAWSILPGSAGGAHSMLNVVRFSHHPYTEAQMAQLTDPNAYGIIEMGKSEHQNLPSERSSTFTYNVPGTYYVRGVARIYDDANEERIYWTPEALVKVLPVTPTTNVVTVTHAAGNFVGGLDQTSLSLKLGDGIFLQNDDVTPHTFTFDATPKNGTKDPVTVAADGTSPAIHFLVPGDYVVRTDDVNPITLTIKVQVPTAA